MTNLGYLLGTVMVLSTIATASFLASSAMANGVHAGSREVYAGNIGPYFMKVTTAPFVGTMHFIVYVSRAGGPEPVHDAEIRISGRHVAGEFPDVGPTPGVASLDGPNLYTVDLPVEEVGEWVFTAQVGGSLGEGAVDIPLTVGRRGGVNLGVIGIVVVLAVVAGLAALSWGRKRSRGRRGPPAGARS